MRQHFAGDKQGVCSLLSLSVGGTWHIGLVLTMAFSKKTVFCTRRNIKEKATAERGNLEHFHTIFRKY